MIRPLKILLILLLTPIAASLYFLHDARYVLQQPLNISEPITYEISAGSNLGSVLGDLMDRKILSNPRLPFYLKTYARVTKAASALKAGEYQLTPGMSGIDMLRLFVSGKNLLHHIRLVEGWSFAEALAIILNNPHLTRTLPDDDTASLMAAIGQTGIHPEGRFFPDTYHFPKGTTDIEFLRRAFSAMDAVLIAEWDSRATDLPYSTPMEALVMASIIEKETAVASERTQIAGVFVNRLRLGMRLQTDPTVIYGLGKNFDGNIRRNDLTADTPYNTYTRTGLPPTPICLPGRASINAALHPAATKALFFVSRGDGTHVFSSTLEEHNAAVDQFQRRRRGQH